MTEPALRAYVRAYRDHIGDVGPWMTFRLDAPVGRYLVRQETAHSVSTLAFTAKGAECAVHYHVGTKRIDYGPAALDLFEAVWYRAQGLLDTLDLELLL
jgi:hypothetical protein